VSRSKRERAATRIRRSPLHESCKTPIRFRWSGRFVREPPTSSFSAYTYGIPTRRYHPVFVLWHAGRQVWCRRDKLGHASGVRARVQVASGCRLPRLGASLRSVGGMAVGRPHRLLDGLEQLRRGERFAQDEGGILERTGEDRICVGKTGRVDHDHLGVGLRESLGH
jgi:hypothetical protein